MIGIYRITNLINHKHYIGQSMNIAKRWQEHCRRSEQQIDQSIQKHGVDNFEFIVLEECAPEQLNEREDFWIQQYNSIIPYGYNMGFCHAYNFGECNANHALTNEDVILMRQIYNSKKYHTTYEVGQKYFRNKISQSHFRTVFRGDAGSHIMPEVFTEENNDYYNDITRYNGMCNHQNGEQNQKAIVTEEEVVLMRALYVSKTRREIFKYFPQYNERTITAIISGQNGKHLPIYEKRKKNGNYPENYTELEKTQGIERIKQICLK